MTEFYEKLDDLFDKINEKIGIDDDLLIHKNSIIDAYEKERGDRVDYLLKLIKPKSFIINEKGVTAI